MWRKILFVTIPVNVILGLVLVNEILSGEITSWKLFGLCLAFTVIGFCIAILLINPDQYHDYDRRGESIKKAAFVIRRQNEKIQELESKLGIKNV